MKAVLRWNCPFPINISKLRKLPWHFSNCKRSNLSVPSMSVIWKICSHLVFELFLTAAFCPKRDFYKHSPPHPPKIGNRLLYCILKIACLLYCVLEKALQKAGPKQSAKRRQKRQQERWEKELSLSWCCLETDLKPVLFFLRPSALWPLSLLNNAQVFPFTRVVGYTQVWLHLVTI